MNLDALNAVAPNIKPPPPVPQPQRRWATRIGLPALIVLVTGSLFVYAARDALLPALSVDVVRVVVKETMEPGTTKHVTPRAATVSVQAPGWVEPDPYAIYVTALTNGIVEEVLVLEGETVDHGQIVAKMVDDDARLQVMRAEAVLSRRNALLKAAQTDWDHPIALQREVAVSKARVAESMSELAQLEATIAQQTARLKELQASYDRLRELSAGAASRLEVETAEYQLDAQQALLNATEKQRALIEARRERFRAELVAAENDLSLRVEQKKALEEATASVREAEAAVSEAKLRLQRMNVVTTASGIVMKRLVSPGAKVMFNMDSPHSAHVIHIYDPKKLQVRVDVPLSDAAKVGVGQPARVMVDILPDLEMAGRVTRFVHQADISKNTVEVKVAIENPSPLLKPDMLARVKFLATGSSNDPRSTRSTALTVFAPRQSVRGNADDTYVWLVTPETHRLRRQQVRLGVHRADDWVTVIEGLNPGDVLVAGPTSGLEEGRRVTFHQTEQSNP